jgi:hypothetical protein
MWLKVWIGVGCAFAALCTTAQAQTPAPIPKMNAAEGAQLMSAAGFEIQGNQMLDACQMPSTPHVDYFDIDGHGHIVAVVQDSGACYGGASEYFAVMIRDNNGKWRPVINQLGMLGWLKTKNLGWPDIEVGGPDDCAPIYRYGGKIYDLYKKCPG